MNGFEERLTKLEKQVRVYRVLTIIPWALLVLLLGWIGFEIWYSFRVIETKEPPIGFSGAGLVQSRPLLTKSGKEMGRSILTGSVGNTAWVSLVARDGGWAMQMHDQDGKVGDNGEMSFAFRVSPNDGSPTLHLIDKGGKEVWHTP